MAINVFKLPGNKSGFFVGRGWMKDRETQGRGEERRWQHLFTYFLGIKLLPKPVNFHGGGSTPLGHGGKWTINRILGTVPVEPDGSAYFDVPAGRSIFLSALDKDNLSVKTMRSFFTVMPGGRASCVGCHEHRTAAAPPGSQPLGRACG